jgi:hypothetical protein
MLPARLPQAGLEIDRVCLSSFPLVPVLRRLLPTVYCLPTFPLVTCHSSLHLGGKKPQTYKAGRRYLLIFGCVEKSS